MNKTHDPEDEMDQVLDESLKQNYKAMEERDSQGYNGVVGVPPDWVPKWAESFFRRYRNRLLDVRGYTPNDLFTLINQYDEIENNPNGFRWPTTYPNEQRVDPHCFQDEIGFLAWLKWCVAQGKEKGLEILGGGFAVSGLKFSGGGALKKGKEYEPKKSIRKICEKIGTTKFNDVLRFLSDYEECCELYGKTHDRIDTKFIDVDEEKEKIYFLMRGKPRTEDEEIKFSRLRNILSEINK